MPALVTLTTDFGMSDHYVAQMKGVILGITRTVATIDVTHAIPPQDVRRAAYLVADLADAFPSGTVHVVVVDPGVGSQRAILAFSAGGQFYIAPDNGVLSLALDRRDSDLIAIDALSQRASVSSTFHGRDVMAPAAARLAGGARLTDLGRPLERSPVRLAGLEPTQSGDRLDAEIAWIDRFGNAITNVRRDLIDDIPRERLRVSCGDRELVGLKRYYAEAGAGEPLLLIGSSERLEIAVNGGSAACEWNLEPGRSLTVDAASA